MKYSFMSFSAPELSLEDMLALGAELGYDGIEPRLDENHAHGVEVEASAERRREVRGTARASGVEIACLATSCCFADPETQQQTVSDARELIDLAADVGAACIRVFGGQFSETVSREQATNALAQTARALADHAAECGVTVCVETHDAWCDPAHLTEALRRADHPAIAANWDIMHPVRGGFATIEEAFEVLKPWIRHLHVHDGVTESGQMRLMPIGTGDTDHRRALELLKDISYDGFISGEWIGWEPHETHLPRELATLKRYEKGLT